MIFFFPPSDQPVRGRRLVDGDALDLARVPHVGTTAQVNQRAAAVHRRRRRLDTLAQDAALNFF